MTSDTEAILLIPPIVIKPTVITKKIPVTKGGTVSYTHLDVYKRQRNKERFTFLQNFIPKKKDRNKDYLHQQIKKGVGN